MATWIISIAGDSPDHWNFAKEDKFWDTRQRRKIAPGDNVYFWQTSPASRLVSRVRSTSAVEPIGDRRPGQWHDGGYLYRFTFDVLGENPTTPVTWKELKQGTGVKAAPNIPVLEVKESRGEEFLKSLFITKTETDIGFNMAETPPYVPGDDVRERALAEIVTRQGQPQFRQSLRTAYTDTCVITGCTVAQVLEAAHIDRYYGEHSNHVTNGLLLRADIHTLFDLHLITVSADHTVLTAPDLTDTEYAQLDGKPLRVPEDPAQSPNLEAIDRHREECSWVHTAQS